MELTEKENKELDGFKAEYPTMWNILEAIVKRVEDL